MPRINRNTVNYPKGYLMNGGEIPADANFIIVDAVDLKGRGQWNWQDKAASINPEIGSGGLLDRAYAIKMPVILRFTVQVEWQDFKPDTLNPQNDKQLNIFKHALKGPKPGVSYVGIILGWESTESEGNTAETLAFYGDMLEKHTGVPVFLEVHEAQWQSMPHLNTTIGQDDSHWPLAITKDYESIVYNESATKQAAIQTPGQWLLTRGALWEEKQYKWRFWEEITSFKDFFGMEPYNAGTTPEQPPADDTGDDTGDDTTNDTTGQAELIAELKTLNAGVDALNARLDEYSPEDIHTIAEFIRKLEA